MSIGGDLLMAHCEVAKKIVEIDGLRKQIATLEAQLAEAKRDFERLEWMIDNGGRVASWEEDRHRVEYLGTYGQMAGDWAKTPREAIDAAIKAKEAQ